MQGPAGETREGNLAPRFSSRRIPNLDGGGVGISVAGAKISRASGGAYAPLPFRGKVFRRAGISLKTRYLGINNLALSLRSSKHYIGPCKRDNRAKWGVQSMV